MEAKDLELLEELTTQSAQVLGLKPSRGRDSRYVGVCRHKATGKWQRRGEKQIFDMEIQAALAFRQKQLKDAGQSKEAEELQQVQEAIKAVAADLLEILCWSCQTRGATCQCKEKALREVEAAKSALEAIRAAHVAQELDVEVVAEAAGLQPPRAKTIDEYYGIQEVRKRHQLDRRRAKELRRRLRREQLEGTLHGKLGQGEEAEEQVDEQGQFATLRRHFLQSYVRRKKKKRKRLEPEQRLVLLQRFGAGLRVIGFHDAAKRLQQLQDQKAARQRLQEAAEMGEMVPMTPQGRHPDISVDLDVEEPRIKRHKRLRTPTDILLRRLVEKRRKEAEEAREAAGDEVMIVSMELDAVKGELAQMAQTKAAKLEWLLLQRLVPEPVLNNVKLDEEERNAQLEEERLQKEWELEGGAEEEERIAKEWRGIMRQRHQTFFARRGAARWLRLSGRRERQLPAADTAPPTIPAAAPAAEAEHAPAEPTEDMAMMDPYLFV